MQPTDGEITQEFGRKIQASGDDFPHTGDDFGVHTGTDVRTISEGVVIFAGWNLPNNLADRFMMVRGSAASGLHMLIQHDGWVELMAHLSEILVFAGATVRRGQVVAKSGATGRVLGAHLHYEVMTEPCGSQWPFGRYNPQSQIEWEDANADPEKDVDNMPLSAADIKTLRTINQEMHDVTRVWLNDRVEEKVAAAVAKLTSNTQAQHDVTRKVVNDQGQRQEDVTRTFLKDRIQEEAK